MQTIEFAYDETHFCRDEDFGFSYGCEEDCQCRQSYILHRLRYTFDSSCEQPVTDRTVFTVTTEKREVRQYYFNRLPVPIIPDAEFHVVLGKDVVDDEISLYQPHLDFLIFMFGVGGKLEKLKTDIVRQVKTSKASVEKSQFDAQIKEIRDLIYRRGEAILQTKDSKLKKLPLMILNKLSAVIIAAYIDPCFPSEKKECAHVSRKKK